MKLNFSEMNTNIVRDAGDGYRLLGYLDCVSKLSGWASLWLRERHLLFSFDGSGARDTIKEEQKSKEKPIEVDETSENSISVYFDP